MSKMQGVARGSGGDWRDFFSAGGAVPVRRVRLCSVCALHYVRRTRYRVRRWNPTSIRPFPCSWCAKDTRRIYEFNEDISFLDALDALES